MAGRAFWRDPWLWVNLAWAAAVLVILRLRGVIGRGSLGKEPRRGVDEHPAWAWFFAAILPLLIAMLGSSLGLAAARVGEGGRTGVAGQLAAGVGFYGLGVGTGAFLFYLMGAGSKRTGLRISGRGLAWGIVGFLCAWPLVALTGMGAMWMHKLVTGSEPSRVAHSTLELLEENRHDPRAWALAGLAIFAAPLMEEIVYRGFLQSGASRLFRRGWIAVLVSSVVFAGLHVSVAPWYAVAAVAVFGVCLGVAFERTRDLGTSLAMHVLYNAANVTLLLLGFGG